MSARLHVLMYHYVRDLPRTRFPRIKGMLVDDFKAQVAQLSARYEMASLSSALDFLDGKYQPKRDLCLLTFDDGLKDHWQPVTELLADYRISGLFFLITSGIEEHRVLGVHKNHFLMAALEFDEYRVAFEQTAKEMLNAPLPEVDRAAAKRAYRWDTPDVATFKYRLKSGLPPSVRDRVLDPLFNRYLGNEDDFAKDLYVTWGEARQMQAAGMLMGGHTHNHCELATFDNESQRDDLSRCTKLLRDNLSPQAQWPFSYPYGKLESFNAETRRLVADLGYDCAFSTEIGANQPGQDRWAIRRIDPKDAA